MNPARIVPLLAGIALLAGCASAPAPVAAPQSAAALRERVFAVRARVRAHDGRPRLRRVRVLSFRRKPSFHRPHAPARTGGSGRQLEAFLRGERGAIPLGTRGSRGARLRNARSEYGARARSGRQADRSRSSVWHREAPGVWRIVLDKERRPAIARGCKSLTAAVCGTASPSPRCWSKLSGRPVALATGIDRTAQRPRSSSMTASRFVRSLLVLAAVGIAAHRRRAGLQAAPHHLGRLRARATSSPSSRRRPASTSRSRCRTTRR